MNEEAFEKYEQDYIKEHTTTIHGYTEEYVKKLEQENQQLKEQLKQRNEVIDEAINHIKTKINKSFNYDYGFDTSNPNDRLFTETVIELQVILEILQKYKGNKNE